MITYKYNIYHSKKTKYLDKMLRECCFVWNHALSIRRRYYKLFGKYISIGKMKKHFAKRIKRNLLHSQTTQEILERLDESYNRFFKRKSKRPPKFKRSDCFNSFVFKQGGFTLNGNILTINKGKKRFKFSYSRAYEGNVKQIRIVRETCYRFSLIIVTDYNPANSYRKTYDGASLGLDFGLKTYLTKSDGSKINSPLFFKQYQNKIRKLNRKFSNAKKGSNNRKRRLFELQQAYRKINDFRSDFQWKLAHELCKRYDYIFIEDLNIEGMKRLWGNISKSVLALVAGAGLDERLSKSSLELAYDRCKMRYVFDPRNRDIHGVVVGYSNDFNSLVAVCDEGSKKGVDKGSTDFVDVNERYVTNGFFYISVEDADKQSNYMGGNS